MTRYGIMEWYGEPFAPMPPDRRQSLAKVALGGAAPPICPFQAGDVVCGKKGGVCSFQQFEQDGNRIGKPIGSPVVLCPKRLDQDDTVLKHLAKVVGFNESESFIAHEVPFMRSPTTGRAAGFIDMVLADGEKRFKWFGLEIQSVYFSGAGMQAEFERLLHDNEDMSPYPNRIRRPDWRSSSAKRLMPQLQTKVPMLRQWGTKMAVAVDVNFFGAIGGISNKPSHDVDDGDIIWIVVEITKTHSLVVRHWEVLRLEDSVDKLLAAERIKRREFEDLLRAKLQLFDRARRK